MKRTTTKFRNTDKAETILEEYTPSEADAKGERGIVHSVIWGLVLLGIASLIYLSIRVGVCGCLR